MSVETIYTEFGPIRKILLEGGYKFIALFDQTGKKCTAYNSPREKIAEAIKKIQERLNSPALPDGIYTIQAKASQYPTAVTDMLYFQKGELNGKTIVLNNGLKEKNETSLGSAKEYMDLRIQVMELKLRNEALEKEIASLNEECNSLSEDLAEYEEQSKEEPKTLEENSKTFLSEILPIAKPYLDEFLEQRRIKLGMEAGTVKRTPTNATLIEDFNYLLKSNNAEAQIFINSFLKWHELAEKNGSGNGEKTE